MPPAGGVIGVAETGGDPTPDGDTAGEGMTGDVGPDATGCCDGEPVEPDVEQAARRSPDANAAPTALVTRIRTA